MKHPLNNVRLTFRLATFGMSIARTVYVYFSIEKRVSLIMHASFYLLNVSRDVWYPWKINKYIEINSFFPRSITFADMFKLCETRKCRNIRRGQGIILFWHLLRRWYLHLPTQHRSQHLSFDQISFSLLLSLAPFFVHLCISQDRDPRNSC